jgi:phage repressor protein C with HTH and peptisase S24 domain
MSDSQPTYTRAYLHGGYTVVHTDEAMPGKTIQQIVAELLAITSDNQEELAKKLGVSQPQISRWLNGAEPRQSSIVAILTLAQKHGLIQSTFGIEHTGREGTDVVGYVGAGGQISFSDGQGPFEQVPSPPNSSPTMVAVRVQGDSMYPMIGDGGLAYYDSHETGEEIAAGKPYVVGLADGRVLIKQLVHGRRSGCYDLYSINAEPILDQPVTWFARVRFIVP